MTQYDTLAAETRAGRFYVDQQVELLLATIARTGSADGEPVKAVGCEHEDAYDKLQDILDDIESAANSLSNDAHDALNSIEGLRTKKKVA